MNLNQVTLPATNLAESIGFYERLGLRLIVRNETYARFELPDGDATLSLYLVEGPANNSAAIHVCFECDDLDDRFHALVAQGVAFDSAPQDQPWLWREAWLHDPAGNEICLYRAGDNRKYPPWRIG